MKNSQRGFAHILLLLIIVVVIGVGIYYFWQNKTLTPHKTENEFAQWIKTVPAEENASVELQTLTNVLTPSESTKLKTFASTTNPTAAHIQEVKAILATKTDVFRTIDAALEKPKYQCVLIGEAKPVCLYNNYRNAGTLIAVQAHVLFRDGKAKEAMDMAFKGLDLAQKIENGSSSYIEYLVGVSMKITVLNEIKTIAASGKLSATDETAYATKLQNYTEDKLGLKTAVAYEFERIVATIDLVSSGKTDGLGELDKDIFQIYIDAKKDHAWNPEATRAMFYDGFKKQLSNVDVACGSPYVSSKENIDIEKLDPKDPNYVGKIFYANNIPAVDSINDKRCELVPIYESVKTELSK
jgi:uncharacterized protein (UPF0333 family)